MAPGGIDAPARPEGSGGTGEEISLRRLLGLLPRLRTVAPLREAFLAASQLDAARRWDRAHSYSTLDNRVLDRATVREVAERVAEEEARYFQAMLLGVGRALDARTRGSSEGAVEALQETAARLIDLERHFEAAALLEVALDEAEELPDRRLRGRVHRALGKACWLLGRLDRAAELYARARNLFREAGERSREVVALQGLGNVRAAQGRWEAAEARYLEGLELTGGDRELLRGQLFNNLSQVTRKQGRLREAGEWQERAEEVWSRLDAPDDRVVAFNNAGLLALAHGDLDEARQCLLDGLVQARTDLQRTALLTHLARVELESGEIGQAEGVAREAEEFAILCGATDYLVEIYTILGRIFRERGDDQGVGFFEKALELDPEARFPLARAEAHLEYGRLRREMGDEDEARAHLERAREICHGLGATVELVRVSRELGD